MRVWLLSEEKRRRGGFSAVELLLGIAIVVVMVILLLPVLGEVRSNANKRASQGELHHLHSALKRYAHDYSGYTPVAPAINGGDFHTGVPGQTAAGREVWGITPAYINPSGTVVTSYTGQPPENTALGYGVLAAEDYVKSKLLWTRSDRAKNEEKMYQRAAYFGDALQIPWSDPAIANSGPWEFPMGGSNFFMYGSYTYRSVDWTTFSYDAAKTPVYVPTPGVSLFLGGTYRNTSYANARPTTAGYTTKSILVENDGTAYGASLGANVLIGDGSAVFWNSPEHAAGVYSTSNISTYPYNPISFGSPHRTFRSLLMDAADKFRDTR